MRLAKALLVALIALVALVIAGGLLIPPRFSVVRSVSIDAPPERVYALVANPRAWPQWSAWHQRDPAMKIDYSGPATGAGAAWAWHSASEGEGEMTFTAAEPDRRLAFALSFPDFGTTSTGELALAATPAGATRVTWTLDGDMGASPPLRWMALLADDLVGKDFEAGLGRLKALAEATR